MKKKMKLVVVDFPYNMCRCLLFHKITKVMLEASRGGLKEKKVRCYRGSGLNKEVWMRKKHMYAVVVNEQCSYVLFFIRNA